MHDSKLKKIDGLVAPAVADNIPLFIRPVVIDDLRLIPRTAFGHHHPFILRRKEAVVTVGQLAGQFAVLVDALGGEITGKEDHPVPHPDFNRFIIVVVFRLHAESRICPFRRGCRLHV